MSARLVDDHVRAKQLSDQLIALSCGLTTDSPQTNIIQVDVSKTGMTSHHWVNALAEHGILTRPLGGSFIRCVTHRHITQDDIEFSVCKFALLAQNS